MTGSPPIDLLARAELLPGVGLDALGVVGVAAFGARAIFGWGAPRLEGTNLRAAADARDVQFVVIGPDGIGAVDATVWLVTDDGVSIRADYAGEIVLSDELASALECGGTTGFDGRHFRLVARFFTTDPRYAWLRARPFLADGRLRPGAVEWRLSRAD